MVTYGGFVDVGQQKFCVVTWSTQLFEVGVTRVGGKDSKFKPEYSQKIFVSAKFSVKDECFFVESHKHNSILLDGADRLK